MPSRWPSKGWIPRARRRRDLPPSDRGVPGAAARRAAAPVPRRRRSRLRAWEWTLLGLVAAALLLPALPVLPSEFRYLPLPPAGPTTLVEVRGTLRAAAPPGGMGPPLVVVEAARYPCEGYDACQILASTTSEANGSWSLWVPSGRYLLSTNGTGGYGGATASVNVTTPPVAPVPLVADPQIVYENATFVLPDWNPLAGYAANCNLPLPCPGVRVPGGSGGQVPLTSWTQDGAFYVNTSLELVFYSVANRSVRAIAPWVPLHDDLMSYDGVEDTEWITADGSYVYEFGCATSCTNDSPVSLYAVNVSTGRTFEGTLRGVDGELFYRNAQMDLIGPEGNLSIASIIDQSGIDIGYDLWSGAQWDLATLPYFEA